ncbi:hypothetical protein HRbin36_02791 [bacterium HR36]|mgnify:CR=1 FL=1|nr:hypothetical protein HRbin36_02791 [bacterium HR36]
MTEPGWYARWHTYLSQKQQSAMPGAAQNQQSAYDRYYDELQRAFLRRHYYVLGKQLRELAKLAISFSQARSLK